MKITCNRRDDILKRKQEYESDRAKRQAKYDEEYKAWEDEEHVRRQSLEKAIIRAIGNTTLDLTIDVGMSFRSGYRIRISDEDNKFDSDKALSWTWEVSLDNNGDVKKESSSWSGMKAVTANNINNLKEIVRVLEILNKIDFKTMLNRVTPPNPDDYITGPSPKYETAPDFDKELMEIDVEDCIGTRKGILGTYSKIYRGDVYHFIQRETPASYTVWDIPAYYVENHEGSLSDLYEKYYANHDKYTYTIRKNTFFETIEQNVTIVDFS